MKINAKEDQLKDPSWWDENVPEDTEALVDYTHFAKWTNDKEHWWDPETLRWQNQGSLSWWPTWYKNNASFTFHDRPLAKREDEVWESGIPPVGTRCHTEKNYFLSEVTILYVGDDAVFVYDHTAQREDSLVKEGRKFFLIETQEQVDEKEIKELMDVLDPARVLGGLAGTLAKRVYEYLKGKEAENKA